MKKIEDILRNKKRFERWTWDKNSHSIVDFKKDGQVIKVYRTKKACDNNVDKLNNNNHIKN